MSNQSSAFTGQMRRLPALSYTQVTDTLRLATLSERTITLMSSNAPHNAFVIEIDDDHLEPRFHQGTRLVVVKPKKLHDGRMVAVYCHQSNQITLCYYTVDDEEAFLHDVLHAKQVITHPDDIIGEVIEAHYCATGTKASDCKK